MQSAVAHSPKESWLDARRGFGNRNDSSSDATTARMRVDYVGVFQPVARYAGRVPIDQGC